MMTIDDEGEGGVFGPMMTSSQKSNFLANFWEFTGNFSKIFHKIFKFPKIQIPQNFQIQKK